MIQLNGLSQEESERVLPEGVILLGYRGSISHGMYVKPTEPTGIDDKDIMVVFIPPTECYLGLKDYQHHEVKLKEWDSVCYEIIKMAKLLIASNPNVLSLLWLRESDYIFKDMWGQLLIEHRRLFVSKRAYQAFSGYAYGQLRKMTHQAFQGYMGDKRRKLVEQFVYDTKNAAHLIRLLRMGIEFLNEGELYVFREDSQQILEIKRGEWELRRVLDEADRLFERAEEAYDRSSLPASPQTDRINSPRSVEETTSLRSAKTRKTIFGLCYTPDQGISVCVLHRFGWTG
ncbi:MAG: nucleotidyltransferase domain-containing protein, partial [Nitrososphaera sp.]|nr:nucleotidyltransferase domain-containing protein [Nitrososphaera sp.]